MPQTRAARRSGSDSIADDAAATAASDILDLRYPPGSRVVLMEAPFDSKRVQVLSEGFGRRR